MRRLHLKLFYLRTRSKREAQGVTAKTLGVRPATMSHLEQGRSLPTLPMLLSLCEHYDVTPTYLLDDARPIDPQAGDRWTERHEVVARGQWLEVPEGAAVGTNDGVLLCPVLEGRRAFESSAQAQRMVCKSDTDAVQLSRSLADQVGRDDSDLEDQLKKELLSQRKPRNKKKTKPAASATAPARDANLQSSLAAEA